MDTFRKISDMPNRFMAAFFISIAICIVCGQNINAGQHDDICVNIFAQGDIETPLDISVWPGDNNNDGIVDTLDIYALVYYWFRTGTARDSIDYGWSAHSRQAWIPENATYADADGSGRVDIQDAIPVLLNWGKTHPTTNVDGTPPLDLNDESVRAILLEIYNSLKDANSDPAFEITRYIENLLGLNIPTDFGFWGNYPNPFNPSTTIRYRLGEITGVRVVVYNIFGRLVKILCDDIQDAGLYSLIWNGRDQTGHPVSAGIYLCRLEASGRSYTHKMILIR
jgi:hypothetical protein